MCPICGHDNIGLCFCNNCMSDSPEVQEHNKKLIEAKNNPTCKGMKILLFHPICTGDIIISSLAAELFQIKYPGCTYDILMCIPGIRGILNHNPFINEVIVHQDWELYKQRSTCEPGELLKQYDKGYSLYWWNPHQMRSFLEDLELPTDYQHLRIYTTKAHADRAKEVWGERKDFRIVVQIEQPKWHKKKYYDELMNKLKKYGQVLEMGVKVIPGSNYLQDAEIIRQADLMVCTTGCIEHVSAAVGTQTVTLSPVYDPTANCAAYYQNQYQPKAEQHLIVRPKDWCKDYNCITTTPQHNHHRDPPYGFSSQGRFPPTKYKECDYKGFKTCIHEIKPDDIIEKVEEAIELRNKK